ncbi:MAG: purine-nucleoside phosphorylase [Monoglobales bacterium]
MEMIRKAAGYLLSRFDEIPRTVVVLGSGLGGFADEAENKKVVGYSEIPGFLTSTAPGHAGKMICGEIEGKKVLLMSGRFHFYEGYSMQEIGFFVRVLKVAGIKNLIVTNAAGGINREFSQGALMMIRDHIKFFDDSPLRGQNYGELGVRFNDMSEAYTPELMEKARIAAKEENIDLKEGVYAFMPGPSYETPAEIKMLEILGADAVGMSTVPEVITAAHCGMKVLGISCITNMAAGISAEKLSHDDVKRTADQNADKIKRLIARTLSLI